ncbi:MAG: transcription antitermination factor NusB [Bdellovibrionales bacterium]|nr:transcription antitermination factor NusB [Bdellovibrionales bacterium]
MSNRSKAREQVVQILYLMEQSKLDIEAALDFFQKNFESYDREMPFIRSRIQGVTEKLEILDKHIEKTSNHWKLGRIPKIDKNILRLGIFEILYCEDIPKSVVMDEAIELAKKFGEEKSSKFINGILDKIANQPDSL